MALILRFGMGWFGGGDVLFWLHVVVVALSNCFDLCSSMSFLLSEGGTVSNPPQHYFFVTFLGFGSPTFLSCFLLTPLFTCFTLNFGMILALGGIINLGHTCLNIPNAQEYLP